MGLESAKSGLELGKYFYLWKQLAKALGCGGLSITDKS